MVKLMQGVSAYNENIYYLNVFKKFFSNQSTKKQSPFYDMKEINPWHFLWMGILASEFLTALLSATVSRFLWGSVSHEVLIIGAIDSFFVPMIVVLLVIYFTNQIRVVKAVNAQLIQEIEERKKAEADKKHFKISFNSLSGWRLLAVWLEEWRMILIIFCR